MHMEDQKIREDARKIMDAALHAALPDTAVEKALAEMPDASPNTATPWAPSAI